MHLFAKLFIFSCVVVYISAAALSDDLYQGDLIDDDGINPDNVVEDSDSDVARPRPRRFSCDLFSFQSQWATPNHSVCAMRCIATGKKGGTCQNGVCHCRGRWWGK
ncbi:defensin-2 [Chelonus insularis]|uniref:defensin-2 n=1 Tax=Chelonus insularis TaxID=460826 RepID=UPI00158AD039|nr:defensin-2 [Chelonus insularis]